MRRTSFFYLASFGISVLGTSITAIALPLVVLLTTGSPLSAGVVAIAGAVPAALAGLLMGALIDRWNRRTVAALADVITAVSLVLLPLVHLTVGLNLAWFIGVAVLSSFGDVPGLTAREAMVPAIARASGTSAARLIGVRESLAGAAFLIGPAIAGILIAVVEPVTVLWITAALAALAATLTLVIPARAAVLQVDIDEGASPPPAARSVFSGLGVLFRHPLLRALVLLNLLLGVVLAAMQGMVIPVHFAFEGEPQFVGFVLSALAVGLLVGGAGFAVLGHRIPHRVWFVAGVALMAVGFVAIGILGPVWSIFAGAALVGLGAGSLNAVVGLAFVENIPDDRRGSVLGAQNALMTVVPAGGIGLAAVLIEVSSIGTATAVLAGLWIVASVVAVLSRALRRL